MDMQWWGEMYKPDMVIQHYVRHREPRDAAMAVKFLGQSNPDLKTVFPHHHRIQAQPGPRAPPTCAPRCSRWTSARSSSSPTRCAPTASRASTAVWNDVEGESASPTRPPL